MLERPNMVPTDAATVDERSDLMWQNDALCAQIGFEMFFPEKGGSVQTAKKVCAMCEVREQCLEYALANDEQDGIWGGLTTSERKALKKRGGVALQAGNEVS